MKSNIQIIEKPDWVSWDDIHNVLWAAHAQNRAKGILMRYPSLEGDEIRQRIEGKGKMFVAVDGMKLVGTAAYAIQNHSLWCGRGKYAHYCFAAILPDYQGMGIYKQLCLLREQDVIAYGVSRILIDTNEHNKREISISKKAGYQTVDIKTYQNHRNVLMVKWLDGCPFSKCTCIFHYRVRCFLTRIRAIKGVFKSKSH